MLRPHLRDLLPPAPPAGVTLRSFRAGDEAAWLDVIRAGYGGEWAPDTFERCIRSDESFRPERLQLAERNGRLIGVAGAFHKVIHGDHAGYLHMMAVRPEERRSGIGTALLRACLASFREQGRREVVLDTDASRLPAVRLYLRHGFLPFPETAAEMESWRGVLAEAGYGGIIKRLRLRAVPEDAPEG